MMNLMISWLLRMTLTGSKWCHRLFMNKVKQMILVTDIVNRRIMKLWRAFVIKGMVNAFFTGAFYIAMEVA